MLGMKINCNNCNYFKCICSNAVNSLVGPLIYYFNNTFSFITKKLHNFDSQSYSLIIIIAFMTSFSAYAAAPVEVVVDDIIYRINLSEESAECRGFSSSFRTDVNILSTIEYEGKLYPVTDITSDAFKSKGIVKIVIPNSVQFIGTGAFESNRGLTEITFNEGLVSIGSRAFCDCTLLSSVNIPNSVTTIGDNAFYGCI